MPEPAAPLRYRAPRASDAASVHALIGAAGTLERNTAYAYLLLCDHFASTGCVATDPAGALLGCMMGYRPPERPDALFVWQVGVHPDARGLGVASRLIDEAARRSQVRFVEATVGTSNGPSDRLFRSFARRRGAPLELHDGYGPELFPGSHEAERLYRIGPLRPAVQAPEVIRHDHL